MSEEENKEQDKNIDDIVIDKESEEIVQKNKNLFSKFKDLSLVNKILVLLIITLFLVLIVGSILYFIGFFDKKEMPKTKNSEKTKIVKKAKKETFTLGNINSQKLNKQLSFLTNKNLNKEKAEQKEKIENEKKLIKAEKENENKKLQQKEEKLKEEKELLEIKKQELEKQRSELMKIKEEAVNLKNEMIKIKSNLENSKESSSTNVMVPKKPIIKSNSFLNMIKVAKIKGNLYKYYLDEILKINQNVKLCRDDKNRIEIYFGPFKSQEERSELLNTLIKNNFNQSYSLELTQDEYDKRCNY